MSHVTENGQSFEIFRNVNPAMLAATTGGASLVTADRIVALWRDGGVTTTVRDGITDWSWRGGIRRDEHATGVKVSGRGILARFGAFLEDAAVIRRPLTAMVVFPTAPGELIQAYRVRQGRMSVVEKLPSRASDALKTAANLAWETAQRSPNRSGR